MHIKADTWEEKCDIACYFFPECMTHWPENVEEYIKEIKQLSKTEEGMKTLINLRKGYEKKIKTGKYF